MLLTIAVLASEVSRNGMRGVWGVTLTNAGTWAGSETNCCDCAGRNSLEAGHVDTASNK